MLNLRFPIIGIDPGFSHSGVAVLLPGDQPLGPSGHWSNTVLVDWLLSMTQRHPEAHIVVEMLCSYGTCVGRTTFDTAVMVGRIMSTVNASRFHLITRPTVLNFLCGKKGTTKAAVRAAVLDYYPASGGGSTPQIGTAKQPGPLYSIRGKGDHVVDAMAVAIAFLGGATEYTLALEKSEA